MSIEVVDRAPVQPAEGAGRLHRELGRWDTVLFGISAMVAVDTIGAISVGGGQAFTWLLVLFATFGVPSALATAELGAAIPAEGGAYAWVRAAFGTHAGAVTSLLYWAGTPIWVGGSVVVVAMSVLDVLVVPLSTPGRYAFGLGFVLLATLGAALPLRYGKWIPSSGAIGQIVLLVFFTATVAVYGARHGVHGIRLGDLTPTAPVFVAVVPVLLYSFVGVELPSSAAEEMRDPARDVPAAILRAGIAQALMYVIPVLAILAVLPTDRITSLRGLVDALAAALTVYGGTVGAGGVIVLTGAGRVLGWLAGALFVWVLVASGTTWLMGTARSQAAACADGAGPRVLGRISRRTGIPVVMVLVSGAASAATVLSGLAVSGADGQQYFTVALTAGIAVSMLAYLLIFPSFVLLRLRRPELARPFRVPGGMPVVWLVGLAATGWTVVSLVCVLWPGAGTATPDAALPTGFTGRRWEFEAMVSVPTLAVIAAYPSFLLLRRVLRYRRRARSLPVPESPERTTDPVGSRATAWIPAQVTPGEAGDRVLNVRPTSSGRGSAAGARHAARPQR